jgi:hypothetical protein
VGAGPLEFEIESDAAKADGPALIAPMDEVDSTLVRSEVIAIQAVLIAVLRRIAREAPEQAPLLCAAFEDAESIVTGIAMKMDLEDPGGSVMGALDVIEEMRAGVIRDESICGRNSSSAERRA